MTMSQVTIAVKGKNGKDGISINGKDGSIGLKGWKMVKMVLL